MLTLSDNWFICRYRGAQREPADERLGEWVGVIGGGQAQLAEGWVKRVLAGLDPFEARSDAFHENETVTFASMLQQAGPRYEGDIAFNPAGDNVNNVGLIESYQTVLNRAKRLSIEATTGINYGPANNALLLAAGRIADLYMLLGNEAYCRRSRSHDWLPHRRRRLWHAGTVHFHVPKSIGFAAGGGNCFAARAR